MDKADRQDKLDKETGDRRQRTRMACPLPDWHPLISGTPQSVHDAQISVRGMTVSEFDVPQDEWEDFIIEEPT